MASRDDGSGCGCLIVLVLLSVGGCKVYRWCTSNPQSVSNGLNIAAKIAIGLVLAVVLFLVARKYWRYRQRIRKWEETEFKQWLWRNSVDASVAMSKNLAAKIVQTLNETERRLVDAERELAAFHKDEAKIGE